MGVALALILVITGLALVFLPIIGNRRSSQHLTNQTEVGPFSFPLGFLWGAGVSGHQVESGQGSDWASFEDHAFKQKKFAGHGFGHAEPGHIHNYGSYPAHVRKQKSSFERQFKRDLAAAAEIQLTAFRFSFSWSRLFPRRGMRRPDPKAVDYYDRLLEAIYQRKLQPFATLVHFTTPQWFWQEERGKTGWERDDALAQFEQYVEAVVELYGKSINHWCTINEPFVYAYNGYLEGIFPPHEAREEPIEVAIVISRLLKAHAAAYKVIKKDALYRGQDSMVGLAMHTRCIEPERNYAVLDRLGAARMEQLIYWDILDAMRTGIISLSDSNFQEEVPDLEGTMDYLGINYYGRYYLRSNLFKTGEFEMTMKDDSLGVDIYPHGFYKVLNQAHRRYRLPIYILENGIADEAQNDKARQRYLVTHLKEIWNAIQTGADIRGYFHWSLIDGFEWTDGFESRFGLFAVDYKNKFKRTPRKSSEVYSQIINNNAISQPIWAKHSS